MTKVFLIKIIFLAAALFFWPVQSAAIESAKFKLIFPNLKLQKHSDFIEKIVVTVSCAHIEAINAIPMDWGIKIVRMTASEEELHAAAGHGASRIPKLGKLNGAILINGIDAECFNLTVKIGISGDHFRELHLTRNQLKLFRQR